MSTPNPKERSTIAEAREVATKNGL